MNGKQIVIWIGRAALLLLLFNVFFIIGTMAISGMLLDVESEPGLVSGNFWAYQCALISGLILSSRWNGWKLALSLGFAYYGAVT